MEAAKKKKTSGFLLRLLQGLFIGISGVLPGVSGGVLCVAFGIYKPIMEVFSAPLRKMKQHWKLLLPVGIGAAIGFFLLVRIVSSVLENHATLATCAFVGLILGTLPSLVRTAGKETRKASAYLSFFISFLFFFALFMYLEYGVGLYIPPSFFGFLLAGAIWGISIILPGLSSSAILIFLGIFEPIVNGAKHFDFGILLPLAIGGITVIALLSKLVNRLYEKHFSVMAHAILGLVIATIIPILPRRFENATSVFLQMGLIVIGFFAAVLLDRIGTNVNE